MMDGVVSSSLSLHASIVRPVEKVMCAKVLAQPQGGVVAEGKPTKGPCGSGELVNRHTILSFASLVHCGRSKAIIDSNSLWRVRCFRGRGDCFLEWPDSWEYERLFPQAFGSVAYSCFANRHTIAD